MTTAEANSFAMTRIIRLPHHYYRGYPADFSAGPAAARGFLGWTAELRELNLNHTALLLMHLPDTGLRPENAWTPDNPRQDLLETVEWVPRTMKLVTESLPPLVAAARAARLPIAHITMGDSYTRIYPQRQRCLAEVGDAPTPSLEPLPDDGYEAARSKRNYRVPPMPEGADPTVPWNLFPPGLEPQGDDLVCHQTWELHRLLTARGIHNLIYTGWALNWCLWFSPCGMKEMQDLRYRVFAVRGGCVAIENATSADTEGNLEHAYWLTAEKFGDLFEMGELVRVLRNACETS